MLRTFQPLSYSLACSARWAWYSFQPGHQRVCQRHSRAIKDLGFSSAFLRIGQVSQPKVFSADEVGLVFILFSLWYCNFLIEIRWHPYGMISAQLSHPPLVLLWREAPAISHCDRSNEEPQNDSQYEVPD